MIHRLRNIITAILIIVFISLTAGRASAQEDHLDAILDSMFFSAEDDILLMLAEMNRNHNFIYARTSYNNRTTYAGREIGTDQHNLSGQIFYLNSKGIHLGVSGAWYSQMDPSYNSTVLSAGYSGGFKKNNAFRYRIAYNRFFFNSDSSDFDPVYSGSGSAGFTLKSKHLGMRLDYSLLMGQEFGSQLSADVYAKIRLLEAGKNIEIDISPELSFYFGSETVEYEMYSYLADRFQQTIVSDYIYKDEFGLMNTQLYLPLEISIGDLDIELGYTYNLNRSLDADYTYDNTSVFSVSLGYFFMIN